MLNRRLITNEEEWKRATLCLPDAHVLQSWEWGEFKTGYGWSAARILFSECEEPCAAALVLRRPLPRTPFGVLYVPKGPILDFTRRALLDAVLAALEQIAREQHAIFVKIDPDVESGTVSARLSERGWRYSREQIQFKNTMLLDLTLSQDRLLAAMKPKTRYNIRLAQKHGIRVELGTRDDLELFYDMYAETGARDNFLIRAFPYYRDAWGSFIQAGLAQMFLARREREALAGLILFRYGNRAWYFYGASRSAHRELMPNYILQWHAICWAHGQGCTVYDFWGAPDTLNESERMYGVYRFKEGFGGKFTPHIGAYDYVVNPALYFLYTVVRPWYLARLRARRTTSEL